MASALLIREFDAAGAEVATHWYDKQVETNLEDVQRLADIVSTKPRLYTTGLGALGQQKRLAPVLKRFGVFTIERVPADDPRITASCRISHGKIKAINTGGG